MVAERMALRMIDSGKADAPEEQGHAGRGG